MGKDRRYESILTSNWGATAKSQCKADHFEAEREANTALNRLPISIACSPKGALGSKRAPSPYAGGVPGAFGKGRGFLPGM